MRGHCDRLQSSAFIYASREPWITWIACKATGGEQVVSCSIKPCLLGAETQGPIPKAQPSILQHSRMSIFHWAMRVRYMLQCSSFGEICNSANACQPAGLVCTPMCAGHHCICQHWSEMILRLAAAHVAQVLSSPDIEMGASPAGRQRACLPLSDFHH